MSYSIKQLGDKLRQELFDVKGYKAVAQTPNGSQFQISDVIRDDENRQVVLLTEGEDGAAISGPTAHEIPMVTDDRNTDWK